MPILLELIFVDSAGERAIRGDEFSFPRVPSLAATSIHFQDSKEQEGHH